MNSARPAMAEDVDDLLSRLRDGSEEAFEHFYREYVPLVYHIALKMTGDRMEAEDICHDVFLEILHKFEQYDARRGSLEAWLAVRTKSRCLDRIRRGRKFRLQTWDEEFEQINGTRSPSLEETVMLRLQRESLRQALKRIPGGQREVLYGFYYGGRTHKQLAEQLKRPIGTVKSMVRYGLNNLRKQFDWRGWMELPGGERKK